MSIKKRSSLINNLLPIFIVASIGLAFAVGVLWQKVQAIESGTSLVAADSTGLRGDTQPPAQPPQGSAKDVEPVNDSDHIKGSKNARIALIEYSDFECPFCARFHPTAQQVVDEYDGQVMWVYRHFPLDQIHAKARPAAEASECIAEVGGEEAFWKFTEEIFSNQEGTLGDLDSVVTKLGLNQSAFKSCVDSEKYANHVEKEYQSGISAGVTGTPGNILLDTKTGKTILIPGALPFEQVKQSIDTLLAG